MRRKRSTILSDFQRYAYSRGYYIPVIEMMGLEYKNASGDILTMNDYVLDSD